MARDDELASVIGRPAVESLRRSALWQIVVTLLGVTVIVPAWTVAQLRPGSGLWALAGVLTVGLLAGFTRWFSCQRRTCALASAFVSQRLRRPVKLAGGGYRSVQGWQTAVDLAVQRENDRAAGRKPPFFQFRVGGSSKPWR